jgi:two-component system KDP operon response regulator KdpE
MTTERPLRFLVVEDDSTNRLLLRSVLARAPDERVRDAHVDEAPTLADARRFLAENGADLLFLDVRLPDGDGLDLAREVLSAGPDRPRLLVISASVLPAERDAAIAAGCDRFLAKPYRSRELLEIVAGLLDFPPPT